MAAIFSVLLLAHGAAGLTPFLHGSRNGGLSMPTPQSTAVYTPPASPVSKFARRASHVALGWAGSTFFSAQHALAATKDMVAPDTWLRFLKPLVAFWSAIFQAAGGIASLIVVVSLLLNKFQLQLKAAMTSLDNARQKEITEVKTDLTKEITEVKTDLTEKITEVKTDLTKEITELKTEIKTEITELKTEIKTEITEVKTDLTTEINGLKTEITEVKTDLTTEINGLKTEITGVKTELMTEIMMLETRITTGIATQLNEILADWKTSSAAEVERQVKTEIADKRLVSMDDPAQVDRDISAAILKLRDMTMHVTWDEEAEVGMVQATVHRGRLRIAPSSTLDRRSGLGFDLRPNGEALTLSVVQVIPPFNKLLATRDVSVEVFSSKVFNDFKIVNKRFEVLPLSRPPPSSRHPISTLSASLHLTHLLLARQPNSHPTSIPVPAPAARGCGKRFCHPFAWCGRWTVAVCTRSPVRSSARRQTRGRSSRRPEG